MQFKRLSNVPSIFSTSDNTHILLVSGDEVKQIPAANVKLQEASNTGNILYYVSSNVSSSDFSTVQIFKNKTDSEYLTGNDLSKLVENFITNGVVFRNLQGSESNSNTTGVAKMLGYNIYQDTLSINLCGNIFDGYGINDSDHTATIYEVNVDSNGEPVSQPDVL